LQKLIYKKFNLMKNYFIFSIDKKDGKTVRTKYFIQPIDKHLFVSFFIHLIDEKHGKRWYLIDKMVSMG